MSIQPDELFGDVTGGVPNRRPGQEIRYVGGAVRFGLDSVSDRLGERMRCGRADEWTRVTSG